MNVIKDLKILKLKEETPNRKPMCRLILNQLRTKSTAQTPTMMQTMSKFQLCPTLTSISVVQTSTSGEEEQILPQNKLSRLPNLEQNKVEFGFGDSVEQIITSRILQQSIPQLEKFEVKNIFDDLKCQDVSNLEDDQTQKTVKLQENRYNHILNQITGISPDQFLLYEGQQVLQ